MNRGMYEELLSLPNLNCGAETRYSVFRDFFINYNSISIYLSKLSRNKRQGSMFFRELDFH